jgi:hypothetical protein
MESLGEPGERETAGPQDRKTVLCCHFHLKE